MCEKPVASVPPASAPPTLADALAHTVGKELAKTLADALSVPAAPFVEPGAPPGAEDHAGVVEPVQPPPATSTSEVAIEAPRQDGADAVAAADPSTLPTAVSGPADPIVTDGAVEDQPVVRSDAAASVDPYPAHVPAPAASNASSAETGSSGVATGDDAKGAPVAEPVAVQANASGISLGSLDPNVLRAAMVPVPAVWPSVVASAAEVSKVGGAWGAVVVFNVWLRGQLRERRMTQRQLAARSGVNHSTISRLLAGDRVPSLETATKLARALNKAGGHEDTTRYFDDVAHRTVLPTLRVESALRGDEELDPDDVRRVMDTYLLLRARRRKSRSDS